MRITIDYDPTNTNEQQALNRFVKSLDMAIALWEIQQLQFNNDKVSANRVYEQINEILDDNKIIIEDLTN